LATEQDTCQFLEAESIIDRLYECEVQLRELLENFDNFKILDFVIEDVNHLINILSSGFEA
jgi:hypothetical protein